MKLMRKNWKWLAAVSVCVAVAVSLQARRSRGQEVIEAEARGPLSPQALPCLPALRDAEYPDECLQASRKAMLGRLYPLSERLFVDEETGFVGLGTTNPTDKLEVVGNIRIGDSRWDSALRIGTFGHAVAREPSDGSLVIGGGQAHIRLLNDLVLINRNIRIGDSRWDSALRIGTFGHMIAREPSDGSLVIGGGQAHIDLLNPTRVPLLEITGADIAEKFPVSEGIRPGMVVAIDPDHPGQLCLAKGSYNRRVAGVASGANDLPTGTILGNLPGSEKDPPIALSGRVWVYCDAREGSIEPGDLLTTSATPGHAMKVMDHARSNGAILGKAMSGLESGQGLVLVLVSLQ